MLDADIQPLAGAQIRSDSLAAARAGTLARYSCGQDPKGPPRGRSAADSSGVRLSIGGKKMIAGGDFSLTAGHGLLKGHRPGQAGWVFQPALGRSALGRHLVGLFEGVRWDPLNLLPLAWLGLLGLLLGGWLGFLRMRTLGRSITAAVAALRGAAERLEAGDLSHRVAVEDQDDLWDVASAFNHMAVGLERGRQLEIERQRIEDELALARRIQARLLPPGPPHIERALVGGHERIRAREVGGDYPDYLILGAL